ncbi:uncharacterized protein LOC133301863 isoform X2 [Gastrolobium bilobum]|uniref:uncharacterized protein LOC133301863 isoform X2 n=1 Tax=Gastrolobium bilobum TaxID=150636 RepID=UPI002AAF18CE|nr:uncharacterized protein LOC133301863 isoform X2 [Gastrolobium bilobum]
MMEISISVFRSSLFVLFIFHFSSTVTAIRKDISFQIVPICNNTVQGRYLLSDDNGYVCNALSVNSQSRCCPQTGEKFSCHGCNLLSQCCKSYEYCVSCCLNPALTSKKQVLNMKIAKPASARAYASVFEYCAGRCRHSSESVVHENAYLSDFHHCFSLASNSSETNSTITEARLNGINVVVGRQGESCNTVCKLRGQSCVSNKLVVLNHCDIIQKYMSCRGACFASVGTDQPAEVVHDAPKHMNPGSCLYTQTQSILSCDGLHQHTRRLCPCA